MRRGFTIIEMLAVVVIVAALAALIFPVFVQAKDSTLGTVCLSNLRQLGLAKDLYLADNDDRYPIVVNEAFRARPIELHAFGLDDVSLASVLPNPRQAFSQLVRSPSVFVCPLDTGWPATWLPKNQTFHSINGGTSYLFPTLISQTPSTWKEPSENIWASDGSTGWHSPRENPELGVNAVFQDGRAAFAKGRNAPNAIE